MRPGVIVSVPVGSVQHLGIVSDRWYDGRPCVISASKRSGVVSEESWACFTGGAQAVVVGYPGSLSAERVLTRARSRMGRPWDLVRHNCEHFVRWAHDVAPESPQLQRAVLMGVGAFLLFKILSG